MKRARRSGVVTMAPRSAAACALSPADIQRLTLFKWRYALEAKGFDAPECDRLIFLRWLNGRRPQRLR